jgi:acetyl-CoA carboxylase biotin carboxyl carrier protein
MEPMNLTQIQELIKFVAKSGVSEVEIEQKDFKITIKTPASGKGAPVQVIPAAPQAYAAPLPAAPRWSLLSAGDATPVAQPQASVAAIARYGLTSTPGTRFSSRRACGPELGMRMPQVRLS